LDAPAPHYDTADIPDADVSCASAITPLNFKETNITSIIWCTGFNVDLSYIKLPVFNREWKLIHKEGIASVSGLYFLGYPWLRSRKSPILFGILEDADFITEKIYSYSKINSESSQVA
jgi:putative flavoprotein involved in K+ transport